MLIDRFARESRDTKISVHGRTRVQQRAIPPIIQDGLLDYGDVRDAGSGALSYSFSKRSWQKFAAYLGTQARYYERYRNVYLIVGQLYT